MNPPLQTTRSARAQDLTTLLARAVVGGLYVYMGLSKALYPVDFLKLLRQYNLFESALWLNIIAASLPWFEVFCGLLLLFGVAVRGTALVSLATLLPFTIVVWKRALVLQAASQIPFCAVRFDCGCGTGEVNICFKLLENSVLMLLSAWLLLTPRFRACLWPEPVTKLRLRSASRVTP